MGINLLKDYSNTEKQKEEKQEALRQKILDQETQEPDASYEFDIDSFMFLDEFSKTIAGIKALFPDEFFEEKTFENDVCFSLNPRTLADSRHFV